MASVSRFLTPEFATRFPIVSKAVHKLCISAAQCTDDSNYVGDYVAGKRHGHGVYSFPNGDRYLGEYEKDIPHGCGVYMFASGQKYEGHWHSGKKHGWCIYTVETGMMIFRTLC